jgi:hypothetical protein
MPNAFKILGQSKPAANTLTDLYTVPASTQTAVSSIICCNQATAADTIFISAAPGGAADAASQYLVYAATIYGNDSLVYRPGAGLQATDKLRVKSTNGTTSFTAFGVEMT